MPKRTIEPELVYLACPYSHDSPQIRKNRFEAVSKCAAHFIHQGVHIMSPISQTYWMHENGFTQGNFDFWQGWNKANIRHCKKLFVLQLPGWRDSIGVKGEVEYAQSLGIPVYTVNQFTYQVKRMI